MVAEAVKIKKELLSIEPQKAADNCDQELAVYEADVLPQYPFKSQIGVAVAQVFPAGSFTAQFGAGDVGFPS